jgi:signal transduction histidine kinase
VWDESIELGIEGKLPATDPLALLIWLGSNILIISSSTLWRRRRLNQEKLRALQQTVRESETQAAIGRAAAQIAHDLRSPLAALQVASRELGDLPSETQALIRGAIAKVRSIADQLGKQDPIVGGSHIETTDLLRLVKEVVAESRLQYRSRQDLTIDLQTEGAPPFAFVRSHPLDLQRAVSNLINNSAEAIGGKGSVTIRVSADAPTLCRLSVEDDGPGIPQDVLSRVTERGATFGKQAGTGLGLYHARRVVESWGGTISINNLQNGGTRVDLLLSASQSPSEAMSPAQLKFAAE